MRYCIFSLSFDCFYSQARNETHYGLAYGSQKEHDHAIIMRCYSTPVLLAFNDFIDELA